MVGALKLLYVCALWFSPALSLVRCMQRPLLLTGHERALTCARYNYEGDLLFTSSMDGRVFVWNAATGDRIGSYAVKENESTVWEVDVSRMYSQSVIPVPAKASLARLVTWRGMLLVLILRCHIFRCFIPFYDYFIYIGCWMCRFCACMACFASHFRLFRALRHCVLCSCARSGDSSRLLTASGDFLVRLWAVDGGAMLQELVMEG